MELSPVTVAGGEIRPNRKLSAAEPKKLRLRGGTTLDLDGSRGNAGDPGEAMGKYLERLHVKFFSNYSRTARYRLGILGPWRLFSIPNYSESRVSSVWCRMDSADN